MPFRNLFFAFFSRAAAAFALACVLTAAGCAYKVEVRQGSEQLLNYMEDLRVGMHREQVRAMLGEAAVPRMLRPNVLLYTYQYRAAGFKDAPRRRTVELVFDDEEILRKVRVLQDDYRRDYRADYNYRASEQ